VRPKGSRRAVDRLAAQSARCCRNGRSDPVAGGRSDANHGAELAKRWCASCHLVEGAQKQASADVPPFAAIANKSDFSAEKLAFFLLDPHPKMPNFPLSRNEAGDIAAYIGSLRK